MNIANNPRVLEHLASSYALGSLRGGARRRFEVLARENASVRVAALLWQERLSAITELQTSHAPSPNVWKRIENLLKSGQQMAVRELADYGLHDRLRRALRYWRGAALAGSLATVAVAFFAVRLDQVVGVQGSQLAQAGQQNQQLLAQLQATPNIQFVAVLADSKAAPAMLVTVDTQNQRLILKRVGEFQEAGDKSLQLWALHPGNTPQSLGVLGDDKVVRMTALETQMRVTPALAISLEPKGGVPGERGPTGPVLFSGALLQTTL